MSRRVDRVADALKQEIAQLLVRDVRDPRIGIVTITNVHVSADLRHARVYFTVHGGEKEREQSLSGLRSASGFIRSEIAHRLELRVAPEIVFEFDAALDEADRVTRLLKELLPGDEDER